MFGGMCEQGKAKVLSIYVGGMGMGADGYFGDFHKTLWSFLSPVGRTISFSPSIPFVHFKITLRPPGGT